MAASATMALPKQPTYETWVRKAHRDGRIETIDNSMWLVRTVPQGAIRDAKGLREALNVSAPLAMAMGELSGLATTRGINRQLAKKKYREFQLMLTSYPRWFEAPKSNPIAGDLNRWFKDLQVTDRRVVLAIRLIPTTGDGTIRGFLDSAEQTLTEGGVLASDYDRDFEQVSAAMDRARLGLPSDRDIASVDHWFNLGDPRPTGYMSHATHMHYLPTSRSQREATEQGLDDCEHWAPIPDHTAITFASVAKFDLGYTPVDDPKTWWASDLLNNLGARVISVRGFVEPPHITKQELKSQKRRINADLEEGAAKGRDQDRREERAAEVHAIQAQYDINKDSMPPTIVDMSVVVGLAGVYSDEETIRVGSAELHIMSSRQEAAWNETMLGSAVRSNPNLHDVPATTLAYSGISNLTRVGDSDGAFLGLTQDRQPVFLSPVAASHGDAAPLMLVGGMTGSGKTLILQWIAKQHALMGSPTVIIDPKENSDLRAAFLDVPGFRVVQFDDLISSDGGLDPLSLYANPEEGIPLAGDMLFRVNPWGDERRRQYEAEVINAIRFGVSRGARVTGQALKIAFNAGRVRREVVEDVFRVAQASPMFRATFGMEPPAEGASTLATSSSVTLFMRGKAPISLPSLGTSSDEMSAAMRQSVNLLRMLLRGSMIALSGRGGVLHMDEAWVLERAVPDELNEIGRLARSMNVLPIMYTQTPSGPLGLGLRGYFSRGLIGHISDPEEATAAMQLFRSNQPKTLERIIAPEFLGDDGGANFTSLKALWKADLNDPNKRTLLRGSEFFYGDLKERFAATTIIMPPEFLRLASTNPKDVERRMREMGLAA